ncbi:MAG: bacillithiol system redox-active protein YtxJ [Saprospiraceae bacterium]|nr:bacillithiol system redox-active protein YtxJ [Saprospiraceae bacterium]
MQVPLTTTAQYDSFLADSFLNPLLLFKHSYRCNLSSLVLDRLDFPLLQSVNQYWIIDVNQHRALSDLVSQSLNIRHESPQALIVYKGECIWDEDHLDILPSDIAEVMMHYREEN